MMISFHSLIVSMASYLYVDLEAYWRWFVVVMKCYQY